MWPYEEPDWSQDSQAGRRSGGTSGSADREAHGRDRGIGRRGRRGRDELSTEPPGQPPAWSGGDDSLEPLPPLDRRMGRQPEFEPEYEGDSW